MTKILPSSESCNLARKRRQIDAEYEKIHKIGFGSYGSVYKVKNRKTAKIVALKKVKLNVAAEKGVPSSSLREIAALKSLNHPNIIQLHEIIHTGTSIYLVLEHLNTDLKRHLESTNNGLAECVVQSYLWQLFKAISYCHSKEILHRDLKLQNLLVDHRGNIKLADFGLARFISLPIRKYTSDVVTLWYRAPEILLGSSFYGPAVDVWSLGCIFFEMLTKRPLFPGNSEIDQLFKIFRVIGTPNEATWPQCTQLDFYNANFPNWTRQDLSQLSPKITNLVGSLLDQIFVYDPMKRTTAKEAMNHPYFENLRVKNALRSIPTYENFN